MCFQRKRTVSNFDDSELGRKTTQTTVRSLGAQLENRPTPPQQTSNSSEEKTPEPVLGSSVTRWEQGRGIRKPPGLFRPVQLDYGVSWKLHQQTEQTAKASTSITPRAQPSAKAAGQPSSAKSLKGNAIGAKSVPKSPEEKAGAGAGQKRSATPCDPQSSRVASIVRVDESKQPSSFDNRLPPTINGMAPKSSTSNQDKKASEENPLPPSVGEIDEGNINLNLVSSPPVRALPEVPSAKDVSPQGTSGDITPAINNQTLNRDPGPLLTHQNHSPSLPSPQAPLGMPLSPSLLLARSTTPTPGLPGRSLSVTDLSPENQDDAPRLNPQTSASGQHRSVEALKVKAPNLGPNEAGAIEPLSMTSSDGGRDAGARIDNRASMVNDGGMSETVGAEEAGPSRPFSAINTGIEGTTLRPGKDEMKQKEKLEKKQKEEEEEKKRRVTEEKRIKRESRMIANKKARMSVINPNDQSTRPTSELLGVQMPTIQNADQGVRLSVLGESGQSSSAVSAPLSNLQPAAKASRPSPSTSKELANDASGNSSNKEDQLGCAEGMFCLDQSEMPYSTVSWLRCGDYSRDPTQTLEKVALDKVQRLANALTEVANDLRVLKADSEFRQISTAVKAVLTHAEVQKRIAACSSKLNWAMGVFQVEPVAQSDIENLRRHLELQKDIRDVVETSV
ncbi:hypothetical protein FRB98_006843 [Tulasnella sp. 332]|nr:hypothetical protein FRB98_006843 [Tulasnella sp. 332]